MHEIGVRLLKVDARHDDVRCKVVFPLIATIRKEVRRLRFV